MFLQEYGFDIPGRGQRATASPKGIDVDAIVKGVQPIAFENAVWAYTLGVCHRAQKGRARTLRKPLTPSASACRRSASPAPSPNTARSAWATAISARCSCARRPNCFCFLAGHESFAAAEGAIGIARTANKVRKKPAARHPQRPGQGRGVYHLQNQRLYLCGDRVRLLSPAS